MIRVGIVGGSGYTGGELIRLLHRHPGVQLDFIYSTTKAGEPLYTAHPDLLGQTDQVFSGKINPAVQVVFLCLGHGNSKAFLSEHSFSPDTRIVDLSHDFRLKDQAEFQGMRFVYGLPELHRETIREAQRVANPGCFATAIQLALLPLASEGRLESDIHVHALTGSTGAGVQPTATTHFSWRDNNVSWYKPFTHQHLAEIRQSLKGLQADTAPLHFIPVRGNFSRGIFATAYTKFDGTLEDALALYRSFYADAPFTTVSQAPVALKQVLNTNQAHVHLHRDGDLLLVTSVIDNLLKGASGQAVQNMNLLFGLPETQGLELKGSSF